MSSSSDQEASNAIVGVVSFYSNAFKRHEQRIDVLQRDRVVDGTVVEKLADLQRIVTDTKKYLHQYNTDPNYSTHTLMDDLAKLYTDVPLP